MNAREMKTLDQRIQNQHFVLHMLDQDPAETKSEAIWNIVYSYHVGQLHNLRWIREVLSEVSNEQTISDNKQE